MKKFLFAVILFCLMAGLAIAQQSYDVTAVWEHDGAAEFRLYQEGTLIDTFLGDVREAPTTITMVEFQHTFTMTAVDGWGRESAHSVPFEFDAPLLDAPGNFRFTF